MKEQIWIEVSQKNVKNNIDIIRKTVGDNVKIAPCVKANAYGHGLVEMAKLLERQKVDWLNVNSVEEAIALREAGIKLPILIIGYISKDEIKSFLDLEKVSLFLYDLEVAEVLNKKDKSVNIHLKIDTGMSRQGVLVKDLEEFITKIKKFTNLKIEGIATHLATADQLNNLFFKKQIKEFNKVQAILNRRQLNPEFIHCGNTAAIFLHPHTHYNFVRPGIAVYGYYSNAVVEKICQKNEKKFLPTLSLKTKIVQIKKIKKGTGVSYDGDFVADKEMKVALLPVGYYDGYDRKLSNKGEVLVRGERCKILGKVCMNMTIINISQIKNAKVGDEVVLIGQQGHEVITAVELANIIGTINYEVITRLRENIKRHYK